MNTDCYHSAVTPLEALDWLIMVAETENIHKIIQTCIILLLQKAQVKYITNSFILFLHIHVYD